MTACQHCHRPYNGRAIGTHERFCPDRPEVAAATLAAMTNPERPGFARRGADYQAAASGTGATSIKALVAHYGSWLEACEHFGLLVPSVRGGSGRKELNAPLTDDERHACARRGIVEAAATGGIHSPARSFVVR
jgi:hypothetical protein